MPDDTFKAFKVVSEAPGPEKVDGDTLVTDMFVPVKGPDNKPPIKGKNNDNIENKGVPFLYISAQLIFVNASKA